MEDHPKVYLYKRVVHAKMYMDDHFSEQINLETIQSEACFSKFHFIRLFKKIYRVTPHQYLISVRIEKAKVLLRQNVSISQVCINVGFQSFSSFAILFKKQSGVPPSIYQRHYLQHFQSIVQRPLYFIPGCFAEKKGWKKAISDK
jgi:AraC-like DNA-binding protein